MKSLPFFSFLSFVLVSAGACSGGPDDESLNPSEDEIKAATFECGSKRCKVGSQFCEVRSGGAHHIGGGSSESSSCSALPDIVTCRSEKSCGACFPSLGGTARRCGESDGHLTLHVMLP